jgi:hypothetical protein
MSLFWFLAISYEVGLDRNLDDFFIFITLTTLQEAQLYQSK